MIIRNTDGSNDWMFGKGKTNILTGTQAISQNIRLRLLSWKNDCFFAMDDGVDYRNLLDKGQEENLKSSIKSIILGSFGVIGVKELSVSLDSARNLLVTYSVDTIYSQSFTATLERSVYA